MSELVKRIRCLTRRSDLSAAEFQARWLHAFTRVTSSSRLRVVACMVLHDVPGCEVAYDAISMEWLDPTDPSLAVPWKVTSARHEHGVQQVDGPEALVDPKASVCVIADEIVLRGADWLARRWANDAAMFKHMALARKAHGLSAAEFSERWRNRPGQLGGGPSAPVITIPDAARGQAYVQNHPRQPIEPSAFDAINEVYFDDLNAMRTRIEFFAQQDLFKADIELISQTHFAVVREHVICAGI